MIMRLRQILIAACFTTLLSAGNGASASADPGKLVAGIIAGHIIPGYEALKMKTTDLERTVNTACGAGNTPSERTVQTAYRAALAAWMGVQHLRFGPAMVDDRFYRYQYWPDKHGQGGRQMRRLLAGPIERIPDLARIGETSVAVQGFPALERLLFPGTPETEEQRAKTCKLAISITRNLTAMTTNALQEWQKFKPESAQETISQIVRAAVEQLQIIANLKLSRPMGKSLKKARPRRAESWRSAASLANISQNYLALKELVDGSGDWKGLRPSLVASKEQTDAVDALSQNLSYGSEAIGKHGVSLAKSVKQEDGRKFVTFLIAHTEGIRDLVVDNVAPALGVNLGFNEQDGD